MAYFAAIHASGNAPPVDPDHVAHMASFFADHGYDVRTAKITSNLIVAFANSSYECANECAVEPVLEWAGKYYFGQVKLYRNDRHPNASGIAALEIVAQALQRGGSKAVGGLNGEFVFGEFDRETGKLQMFRDHFGLKSAYYAPVAGTSAIASFVPALLRHPRLDSSLDETSLAHYLLSGYSGADRTCFREIKALQGARRLATSGAGDFEISRYWHPRPKSYQGQSEEQRHATIRESVIRSVLSRIPESGDPGVTLSGGLDSSCVAAIACACLPERHIRGFTAVAPANMPEADSGERQLVGEIASRYPNLSVEFFDATGAPRGTVIAASPLEAGGPFANPLLPLSRFQLAQAAKAGVTTLFNGDGGDSFVSYYDGPLITDHLIALRFREAWRVARKIQADLGISTKALIMRHFIRPFMPLWLWRLWHRLRLPIALRLSGSALTIRGFEETGLMQWLRDCDCDVTNKSALTVSGSMLDGIEYLARHDMSVNYDAATFGLHMEHLAPLYDIELVQAVAGLPTCDIIQHDTERLPLRRVAREFLPGSISEREEKGHGIPGFRPRIQECAKEITAAFLQFETNPLWSRLVDRDKIKAGLEELAKDFSNESGDLSVNIGDGKIGSLVFRPYKLGQFLMTRMAADTASNSGP